MMKREKAGKALNAVEALKGFNDEKVNQIQKDHGV